MTIKAVVFDIGGILEITPETGWQEKWSAQLRIPLQEIFEKRSVVGRDTSLGACSLEEWFEGVL